MGEFHPIRKRSTSHPHADVSRTWMSGPPRAAMLPELSEMRACLTVAEAR
jgi:hypothetical protein